ncbi:MAG: hypothetical protein LBJ32_01240, partial [Oscillospiraceae bacterium]|nr:hypothetical protein [Oscillospiraceae bacterium]
NTHLEDTKRLENLILILAIGSYWANSVGFAETNRIKKKKLIRKNSIKNFLRSKVSNFKKGLRIIINLALNLCFSHDLWCCLS